MLELQGKMNVLGMQEDYFASDIEDIYQYLLSLNANNFLIIWPLLVL